MSEEPGRPPRPPQVPGATRPTPAERQQAIRQQQIQVGRARPVAGNPVGTPGAARPDSAAPVPGPGLNAQREEPPRFKRRRDTATYTPLPINQKLEMMRSSGEWMVLIAGMVIIAILIKVFVLQAFVIPSGSMEDTLEVHDYILVDKLAFRIGDVHRGDIVVFNSPPSELALNPNDKVLVKRVIGLPGDKIQTNDNGDVTVNGAVISEPYLKKGSTTEDLEDPVTLDADQFFMMGDNRNNSQDSRYFGTVDRSLLIGKTQFRVFPPWRLHFF